MFDDSIKQAQQQSQNRYRKMALVLLFVGAAVAVLAAISGRERSNDEPLEESAPLSQAELDQAREAFKIALAEFEQGPGSFLNEPGLTDWGQQRLDELLQLKQKALNAFANSDYATALEQLAEASRSAKQLKTDWDAAFAEHFAAAEQAFAEQQLQQSELALNKALAVKPDHPEAVKLQQRLAAAPAIQTLLADAQIARTENNPRKELELLQQVLDQDPSRSQVEQRLKQLQTRLGEQYFAQVIDQGLTALAQNDLAGAKQALASAQRINAKRTETQQLAEAIGKRERNSALAEQLAAVEAAVVNDDWAQVNTLSAAALQRFSGNAELQQYQQTAGGILRLHSQLDSLLQRPERLSDSRVRGHAQGLLDMNQNLAQSSFTLLRKMSALQEQIDAVNQPQAVQILSDGKTHISVVGVGQVGEVKDKVIELKPGNYVFEGKRDGYRSVRVNFEVQAQQQGQQLEVICRERI